MLVSKTKELWIYKCGMEVELAVIAPNEHIGCPGKKIVGPRLLHGIVLFKSEI